MANSFGDQLLKAGLVSKDQLNKAKKSKHRKKKAKQTGTGNAAADSAKRAAAEKAARDRELNRKRREAGARKAVEAQVRQLVENNRVAREDGDIGYNFQDGTLIRKLYVTPELRDKLVQGQLAIVKFSGGYELVLAAVAEKIKERDAGCVIDQSTEPAGEDANDPYAGYEVPDDLMW